jgi:hypothetical protein
MNGLDLESFLYLLKADLAAWLSLAAILIILALMTWTSWGSRQALRKCLVLSIAVHIGMWTFGLFGKTPYAFRVLVDDRPDPDAATSRIRAITVLPRLEGPEASGYTSPDGRPGRRLAAWDRPGAALAVVDPSLRPKRELPTDPGPPERSASPPSVEAPPATPEGALPDPARPDPPKPDPNPAESKPIPPQAAPIDSSEIREVQYPDDKTSDKPSRGEPEGRNAPAPVRLPNVAVNLGNPSRTDPSMGTPARPGDSDGTSDSVGARARRSVQPGVEPSLSDIDIRTRARQADAGAEIAAIDSQTRRNEAIPPLVHDRALPIGPGNSMSDLPIATGRRTLSDVPEVYRPRLSPNRSAAAKRAGASNASEQAVERALDWLARHQDADGRWDGGTQKEAGGITAKGHDNFTIHCPAGEICFGECFYFEADTAMTGLALLAYLGANYTHLDGKYAQNVARGIQFLLNSQKPNGDLRGESKAVGMYCHCMAALALCEAYALTGDPGLKQPVTLAVEWLAKARAVDKMSWRYQPYARSGDTSILGWVVMVFKSARVSGIAVPPEMQEGAQAWLKQVADGDRDGLARYTPYDETGQARRVTPTMTAEAWVCRQFLGVGGPGPSSSEAAEYLLEHSPGQEPFNLYYWYYGTLAMYQHGGDAWTEWNSQVRDDLVKRQRVTGHRAGSWDTDTDRYGSLGGRIYSTAMATLTLEVYYRYLRLYDAPGLPPTLAPAPRRNSDGSLRRAGAGVP